MSSIGGIGQSAAALTSLLSTTAPSTATGAGATSAPATGADTTDNLLASLRSDIDDAFQKGKSLDDIGRRLSQRVSATLENYGVTDDDRQSILEHLQQIIAEGGSTADVRSSVATYLQQVAEYFDPTATSTASSADSRSAPVGQALDVTA